MESYQTRRGATRSLAQVGNCPICNRVFSVDVIQEHADSCAARLEKRSAGVLPTECRMCLLACKPTADRRRQAAAARAGKPRVKGRPKHVVKNVNAKRLGSSVDVDMIDDFEFRSQGGRSPGRITPRSVAPLSAGASSSLQVDQQVHSTLSTLSRRPVRSDDAAPRVGSKKFAAQLDEMSAKRARLAPAASIWPCAEDASSSSAQTASSTIDITGEDSAEVFLMKVREAFVHQPRRLEQFQQLMLGFLDGQLDTVEVMQHTATLLKGHKKLLKQFNTFLPDNYRIEWLPPELTNYQSFYGTTTLPSAQRAQQLASSFVDRTVERFADRPAVLAKIAECLEAQTLEDPYAEPSYRIERPPFASPLLEQLKPLLRDEPDLWTELQQYVPSARDTDGHTIVVV